MKKSSPVFIIVLLLGCRTMMMPGPSAAARLEPRSGSNVVGNVSFTQLDDGSVRVQVDLTGVPPGVHGFHVHERGDCSAPDATSAGGHFNPTNAPHGPHAVTSHAGDFGNVTAEADGEVHTTFMTRSVSVTDSERSVIGRAVVLNTNPDDLKTQPTGNAGGRIACGVVTATTP